MTDVIEQARYRCNVVITQMLYKAFCCHNVAVVKRRPRTRRPRMMGSTILCNCAFQSSKKPTIVVHHRCALTKLLQSRQSRLSVR